jgi:hypothetical protein
VSEPGVFPSPGKKKRKKEKEKKTLNGKKWGGAWHGDLD